jgi:RNA polymerase sigma factor (sigma-70 family)
MRGDEGRRDFAVRRHDPNGRSRPSLTHQEELELVLAARRGPGPARDLLVEEFWPAIASVARRYRTSPGIDRAELVQEGVVGLLRALERYDPAFETPFWAYATWWVRQAMQQLVAELSRSMVLSDRAQRQLARYKKTERACAQAYGRQPTCRELAAELGMPREQVDNLLAAERSARVLDDPVGEGGVTLSEVLPDPKAEDPFEKASMRLGVESLPALMEVLGEREREILRARFGLDGAERTLSQLGRRLGVSAERVRQIEQGALAKLRNGWEEDVRAV